jgi:hypothetical protein
VTWAIRINGRSAAHTLGTAITDGNFAVRMRLTKFDTEDATSPRGSVFARCVAPGGSIIELV